MTAIDVSVDELFAQLTVPDEWQNGSSKMIVTRGLGPPGDSDWPLVVADSAAKQAGRTWQQQTEFRELNAQKEPAMAKVVEGIRAGRHDAHRVQRAGRDELWVFGPIDSISVCVLVLDFDQIMGPLEDSEQAIVSETLAQISTTSAIVVVVVVVVIIVAKRMSQRMTANIAALSKTASRIAAGDLDARANVSSGDEIEDLGNAFNAMIPRLQDQLAMRQSLTVAMEVQQSLLPSERPEIAAVEICGRSTYCDETGGDYFDYIQTKHLGSANVVAAVGDVTGHGIGAALLMTTARALLRSRLSSEGSLAEALRDVNQHLCIDKLQGRFVTLFLLKIESQAKHLRWISAGHDPAIVYDPASDQFSELKGNDLPLGVDREWSFSECTSDDWVEGRVIVIGTDGVWEARNANDEMFGKDRLYEAIRKVHKQQTETPSAEAVQEALYAELKAFLGSVHAQDDVTLMVIRLLPH